MKLEDLARQYRVNAEKVLQNPEIYGDSTVFQATILLQRNVEKALKTLSKRNEGCISCIHSKPHEKEPVNIKARQCEIGKSWENGCKFWKSLLNDIS